jgi:hypothetical protein
MDLVKARKLRNVRRFNEYKQGLSCSECGFSHPAALDFHHRDPATKTDRVSGMAHNGRGWTRILAEIAKCEVLCANCHRILHHDEKNAKVAA